MNELRLICTVLFDADTNEIIIRQPDDLEMRLQISDYAARDFDAEAVWYALFHDF